MKKVLFLLVLINIFACTMEQEISEDQKHDHKERKDMNSEDFEMFKEKEKLLISHLRTDSLSIEHNINLASYYHHLGLHNMKVIDGRVYEKALKDNSLNQVPTDILFFNIELNTKEEEAIVLFRRALNYFQVAYSQDSTNEMAIDGLAGCYYELKEQENYQKFQKKIDEIIK
ncbi:MAG: hypothetical protein MRY83_20225 [Flavobacteriales bacterium]|nr:hypothetical protein [Flavobacteriales bacterium]